MKQTSNRIELAVEKIKKHPVIAALIILAGFITALGTFTDSLDKIFSFVSKYTSDVTEKDQTQDSFSVIAPRLNGQISYLVLWRFSSNRDGKITDRKFIPSLWIKSVDHRNIIVEKVRLVIITNNNEKLNIFPESSVPMEAVNSPCEFYEYGRLATGGPFRGFDLSTNQNWISSYCYSIPDSFYGKLKNQIEIVVEAKIQGDNWYKVTEQTFLFGTYPYHLQAMQGESQAVFIYNRPGKKGDTVYCIDNLGDLKVVLKK